MKIPKDIISIVRCIKNKYEKNLLNCNYYNKYCIYDSIYVKYYVCMYYMLLNRTNKGKYMINCRDIISVYYRKTIVCFLAGKKKKYKVPKNY